MPAPPAAPSPWAGIQGAVGGSAAHRGLRLAAYLAFAAVALATAVLGTGALQLDGLRDADSDVQRLAGAERAAAYQAGRLAALLAQGGAAADGKVMAQHADALASLAQRSRGDAQQMDAALGRVLAAAAAAGSTAAAPVQPGQQTSLHLATAHWRAARETLWSGSDALLRQPAQGAGSAAVVARVEPADSAARAGSADGSSPASSDGHIHGPAGPGPAVQGAADALQAAVAPAAEAAARLAAAVAQDTGAHAAALRRNLQFGLGAFCALLLLLSLVLVEPAARSARRHARRLELQSSDLQRLALVAEHTSALVVVSDSDDRVQWVNAAFSAAAGCSAAAAVGRRPGELLVTAQSDDAALVLLNAAVREGRGARHEWLHRTGAGRDLWLDVDLRPVRTPGGVLTGFVRVASDVTARVQQQAKLQALWAVLPAGVVVHDARGRVVEANRAAERLMGLSLPQMRNTCARPEHWMPLREDGSLYPANDHPAARTLATGEPVRNETVGLHLDGSMRWLLFNTEPQRDALGQVNGVVSCISDITERRRLLQRLSASARTDALTRLPNRAVVMERLQRAVAHARRHAGYGFAVLFMDFDRFKQVNDTLGHAAGDELLRQIAQRLQRALRPGDAVARLEDGLGGLGGQGGQGGLRGKAVAARLGGDEFVVVLEGVADAAKVAVIAERLLSDLAEPYLLGSTPVQSSVSIGVVLCAGLGATASGAATGGGPGLDAAALTAADVLRNADTAMYEAKRAGRGRWVLFDDSMHERVVRALALETDLRAALRDDALFVVYQPVVDLSTRALDSVEALVRWHHPQRGLVQPAEFVAAAEESGLIDALGAVVLRKACQQFMAWRRTPGAPAPRALAVNLSRAQLQRADLVDDVRAVLADCGMPPALLQLEVTETLAAQDERMQATLRALKALGVKLALDDFGTGYSSLACLHQLPVDTVKIDRSFVQHAETVEYHRVLIEATIRVARTLGMTTVAEGIETDCQAALMLQLDCDRGQGYLFSRPLEAAELERWVREQAQLEGQLQA